MSEAAAAAGTTPAKAVTMVAARTAAELRFRVESVLAQPDKATYPPNSYENAVADKRKLSHDTSNGNDCRSHRPVTLALGASCSVKLVRSASSPGCRRPPRLLTLLLPADRQPQAPLYARIFYVNAHLDIEEVQKLILGGTQEGWDATIDRVKDSTAMTPKNHGRMEGPQVYVYFPGTAREALNFYADVFGGELSLHTYEDFGRSDGPPEAVAHGVLNGVVALAGSDAAEGQTTVRLEGIMLSLLGTAEPKVLHEWFDKLSVDGSVLDPLSPKPWGASDGQVIDRHGLHWLVGYEPAT